MRSMLLLAGLAASALLHAQSATDLAGCGLKLQLGDAVIYSDLPCSNNANGANAKLGKPEDGQQVALLITGAQQQSFDVDHARTNGTRVITPNSPKADQDLVISDLGERSGIYVYPLPAPEGGTGNAYLLQWNRRRIFIAGGTNDTKEVLNAQNVDVAFITQALLDAVNKSGRKIDARTVIVYGLTQSTDDAALTAPCDCKVMALQPSGTIRLFR